MNLILTFIAQYIAHESGATLMPKIIFWLLLILWAIGGFITPGNPNLNIARGTNAVQIILFAILGYYLFAF
jgi:hypothetical protein